MQLSWFVLYPPLIVLICAFITKRVLLSLSMGIICASTLTSLLTTGKVLYAIPIAINRLWGQLNLSNSYIFLFLLFTGIIIALMSYTGATTAYSNFIKKKLHSAREAQFACLILSLCFLIDDFFSSITVGCIMRPLTDKFNIARAKLAFLIDSMAAPLVILVPISSWIAMITAQLSQAGVAYNHAPTTLIFADPFILYLHIIPFIFYSFITFFSVIYLVYNCYSYGPMRQHELIAQQTHNLFGGKKPLSDTIVASNTQSSLIDFILPIVSLLITTLAALLYKGNFYLFKGTNSFIQALQQSDIFFALFSGSFLTLLISLCWYIVTKKITLKKLPSICYDGIKLMIGSVAVLWLAWTFSNLLMNDLHTGDYLAQLLINIIPLWSLPSMFFIISAIISIAIGSSWGTIAVMIPLAVPMLVTLSELLTPLDPTQLPLLLPLLGAVFAGAVAGDHISPLASTTVMSSTSANCYHIDHVKTQFIYAIPVLISSSAAYLVAGLLINYGFWLTLTTALLSGIFICLLLHTIAQRIG